MKIDTKFYRIYQHRTFKIIIYKHALLLLQNFDNIPNSTLLIRCQSNTLIDNIVCNTLSLNLFCRSLRYSISNHQMSFYWIIIDKKEIRKDEIHGKLFSCKISYDFFYK